MPDVDQPRASTKRAMLIRMIERSGGASVADAQRSDRAGSTAIAHLTGDRGFESLSLRQLVCLTSKFRGCRLRDAAFAGSVEMFGGVRNRNRVGVANPLEPVSIVPISHPVGW